jgi:L-lactate dehydrogenase (cytochrome)
VLKALALGATCAFVGRPFNYAATVGGQAGVAHGLTLITEEIKRDMGLLGVATLPEIDSSVVRPMF